MLSYIGFVTDIIKNISIPHGYRNFEQHLPPPPPPTVVFCTYHQHLTRIIVNICTF